MILNLVIVEHRNETSGDKNIGNSPLLSEYQHLIKLKPMGFVS
jgi:hypothetical protein